jgi:preprotein translocase subunit SecA
VTAYLTKRLREAYDLKAAAYSTGDKEGEGKAQLDQLAKHMERLVILSSIDKLWQDHLYQMDGLREGVGLRSHGQKDPLIEYKTEAYKMFVTLMEEIRVEALNNLFRGSSHLRQFEEFLTKAATDFVEHGKNPFEEQRRQEEEARRRMIEQRQIQQAAQQAALSGGTVTMSSGQLAARQEKKKPADKPKLNIQKEAPSTKAAAVQDVGRNDPCPCGSGKKFKACHGKA